MIHEIIREEESSEQLRENDQLQLTCYSSMVEAYIHVMHGCYNRKLTTLTNLTNLTDTVIQLRGKTTRKLLDLCRKDSSMCV